MSGISSSQPMQHVRSVSAPPRLTSPTTAPTTAPKTTPSRSPSYKPIFPTTKPELAAQLKRESIGSQVSKVQSLLAQIGANGVDHTDNKDLYAQLAKLRPPFLDAGSIGKDISSTKQPTKAPSMFKEKSLDSLSKMPIKKDTTWESAKANFIRSKSGSGQEMSMMMALDHRHREVSTLMQSIGKDMGIEVVLPGQKEPASGAFLRVQICGSAELSSDIDINITAVGTDVGKDTEFVSKFNLAYRTQSETHQESGNTLDVNLYTKGVFPDFQSESVEGRFDWGTDGAKELNNKNQDIASLIKVRKFAGAQWEVFKTKLINDTPPESKGLITEQLAATDAFVTESEQTIQDMVTTLKTTDPKKAEYLKMNPTELLLVANNRLYEQFSGEADTLMESYEATGDKTKLADARFALSKAHYFANEAALSEGVLRRVVVNEQAIPGMNKGAKSLAPVLKEKEEALSLAKAKSMRIDRTLPQLVSSLQGLDTSSSEYASTMEDIETLQELEKLPEQIKLIKTELTKPPMGLVDITTADSLQSFNENFGDILKEIEHVKHDQGVPDETKLDKSLVKSSKYLGRMCRDIESMISSLPQDSQTALKENPKMVEVLKLVDKFGKAEGYKSDPDKGLLAIRKNKPGTDSIETIMQDAGLSYDSAQDYEDAIVSLSVTVNALVRPYIQM